MEISKGAAGIAAAACLIAGASTAYLVTRPSSELNPAAVAAESSVSPDPAARPVEQSEAVVADGPSSPAGARAAAREDAVAAPAARRDAPRRVERSRPRPSARPAPARAPEPAYSPAAAQPEEPRVATEPTFAPALPDPEPVAPAPQFEELVISADSVVGLEVESAVTSERARVEDQVTARVSRDVKVGDRVAIPAGAQAIGEVTLVERGGRMREKARLGVRFTSIVLADGTRVPIDTDTIIREGSSPGGESTAKIGGGAIGGAIIGGILGGAKGAIIGGSAGAGAGTAAVMAGGRNPATLTSGAPITVRLLKPATVTVER